MRKIIWYAIILCATLALLFAGCKKTQDLKEDSSKVRRGTEMESAGDKKEGKGEVTITWLGHSSFLIEEEGKIKVVTDPYDSSVGYPISSVKADIVTISHDHYDHKNIGMVEGNPEIVKGNGSKQTKNIRFDGISSYHDEQEGRKRGTNTIFIWELSGIRFAHMGDFGQDELTGEQISKLKGVDVLLIPVGGTFTIDGNKAREILSQINPKIAIPMHYKTDVSRINISPVDSFLQGIEVVQNFTAHSTSKVTISKEDLPEELEVWVLDYKHATN